jgi:hypothetical protein
MPDYRAHIVGKNGHFESFEVVQADSDESLEGCRETRRWSRRRTLQLARKVAVLKHKSKSGIETKRLFRRKWDAGMEMWRAGRLRQERALSAASASASADCRAA